MTRSWRGEWARLDAPRWRCSGWKTGWFLHEAARVYRERIPNCNISLVYDAGHALLCDRPEAVTSAVADFVERRETFIVGRESGVINP